MQLCIKTIPHHLLNGHLAAIELFSKCGIEHPELEEEYYEAMLDDFNSILKTIDSLKNYV